jgi:succinate dehydrogenase / fumarate reductase cytochrome b subunit
MTETFESGRHFRTGVLAFWLSRIAALALLILLPVKLYTGWVLAGKMPGPRALGALHSDGILDALLLLALLTHAAMGVRVLLLEFGLSRNGDRLFSIVSACAVLAFVALIYVTITS